MNHISTNYNNQQIYNKYTNITEIETKISNIRSDIITIIEIPSSSIYLFNNNNDFKNQYIFSLLIPKEVEKIAKDLQNISTQHPIAFNIIKYHCEQRPNSFTITVTKKKELIGFCCFNIIKHTIFIDYMFVETKYRHNHIGGSFLSLIHDIAIISKNTNYNISFLVNDNETVNSFKGFFAKYFFIKIQYNEKHSLISNILKNHCYTTPIIFQSRLPFEFIQPKNLNALESFTWLLLINIAKKYAFGIKQINKNIIKYNEAEILMNIILHGQKNIQQTSIKSEYWLQHTYDGVQVTSNHLSTICKLHDATTPLEIINISTIKSWFIFMSKFFFNTTNETKNFRLFFSILFSIISKIPDKDIYQPTIFVSKFLQLHRNNETDYTETSKLYLNREYKGTIQDFIFITSMFGCDTTLLEFKPTSKIIRTTTEDIMQYNVEQTILNISDIINKIRIIIYYDNIHTILFKKTNSTESNHVLHSKAFTTYTERQKQYKTYSALHPKQLYSNDTKENKQNKIRKK